MKNGLFARHRHSLLGSLIAVVVVLGSSESRAAELTKKTLDSWDDYIQTAKGHLQSRINGNGQFLWVEEDPKRQNRVRSGKILVSPRAPHVPLPVPGGLIHHWIGAAYFPDTKLQDLLATVRDYDHYREYYKPYVAESRSVPGTGDDDRFSMLLVNREVVVKTALETEYEASYKQLGPHRWYAVAYTTRIQEIREYEHPGQEKLPPDQGSGYIWRVYDVTRFEERDGGVYVEMEALALSRDIPAAFRWMVDPIVRRVSKGAIETSLHQMQEAVRSRTTDQATRGSSDLSVLQ